MSETKAQVKMFPKEKSHKLEALYRAQNKRVAAGLSVFSLIFVMMLIVESGYRRERPQYVTMTEIQKLNRAVASAEPMEIVEDVIKEHDIANRLSKKAPAVLGQRGTSLDKTVANNPDQQ